MIYLDNAATSGKKPIGVYNALNFAIRELSANPGRSGHRLSQKTAEAIYTVRKKCVAFFGADSEEQVIFTKNCTESINIVLKGVLNKDDHVVTTDLEHNAVMRPLYAMGVQYTNAEVSFNDDDITVKNIENAIKENTKLIIVTSASNVFGKALPLKKIGLLASKRNILFAVDGAQGGGVLPIDMKSMNIDFLCLAAHKGLFATMGTGVLIARKPIEKTIIEGGTGTDSINLEQPDGYPERLESGTVNLPGILTIGAGIDFLNENEEKIYKKEMKYSGFIFSELNSFDGIKLYTPYPKKFEFAPVISFNIDGINSQMVADLLDKHNIAVRAGLHCAPVAHKKMATEETGTVRISCGAFNSQSEIAETVQIVKKISKNRKKYVE